MLKLFTRLRPLINVRFTIHEWLFKHCEVRLFNKTTQQIGTFNNDNIPFFHPPRWQYLFAHWLGLKCANWIIGHCFCFIDFHQDPHMLVLSDYNLNGGYHLTFDHMRFLIEHPHLFVQCWNYNSNYSTCIYPVF